MFLSYRHQPVEINTHTGVLSHVQYLFFDSQFGTMLAAFSQGCLCLLVFVPEGFVQSTAKAHVALIQQYLKGYVQARTLIDPVAETADFISVFDPNKVCRLLLLGTSFQQLVWQALLQQTEHRVMAYSELAASLGKLNGVRAVASAVAANRIALYVPCHRVVQKNLGLGAYRWGAALKARVLADEGFESYRQFPDSYHTLF